MNPPPPAKPTNGGNLQLDEVNFRRVLVPVDFSACTLETLRYARALVGKCNAVIDMLHIIEPIHVRNAATRPGSSVVQTMIKGARLELKRLAGILWADETRVAVSIRVREGRADTVILHEAFATNATLIVMGTRNRSWLSGRLRRQTVKHVIDNSPCPVMVIRSGMGVPEQIATGRFLS